MPTTVREPVQYHPSSTWGDYGVAVVHNVVRGVQVLVLVLVARWLLRRWWQHRAPRRPLRRIN